MTCKVDPSVVSVITESTSDDVHCSRDDVYTLGSRSHVSASQGYVYMWVCVSVMRQECHTKAFAGAVITQCIAFAGPRSYTRQH